MPEHDFLGDINHDERALFRKRIVSMILATDMGAHQQHLDAFNNKIINLGISGEKQNGDMFVKDEDEVKKYNSKQQLMDMIIHSCDFALSARLFDTVKKGTYALFEEFFNQGDMEREKNLPISFLCDRNTTFVAKSQPGFLGFVVMPLYRSMMEVIPAAKPALDQMMKNSETWKNYTETEHDK